MCQEYYDFFNTTMSLHFSHSSSSNPIYSISPFSNHSLLCSAPLTVGKHMQHTSSYLLELTPDCEAQPYD